MSTNPFQTLGYSYRKDFSLVKFSSEFMKSRISYCKVYFVEYKANTCCCCIVVLLFYVHGKHLRSCRDGQLT